MKKLVKCAVIAGLIVEAASLGSVMSQEKSVPRVGFVAGAGGYPKMAVTNQAFFDGLAEAGYKDGTTMRVIFRTAEGNMSLVPELIGAVLAEKADYLVVSTSPGCAAAQKGYGSGAYCLHICPGRSCEGGTDRDARPWQWKPGWRA